MTFREKLIALDAALTRKGVGTARHTHEAQADFGETWYWWDTWQFYNLSDGQSCIAFDPAKKRMFLTKNSHDEVKRVKEINEALWSDVEQDILAAEDDPHRMNF